MIPTTRMAIAGILDMGVFDLDESGVTSLGPPFVQRSLGSSGPPIVIVPSSAQTTTKVKAPPPKTPDGVIQKVERIVGMSDMVRVVGQAGWKAVCQPFSTKGARAMERS